MEKIVAVVRALRDSGVCEFAPTIRGSIMIAKSLRVLNGQLKGANGILEQTCQDILGSETSRLGRNANQAKVRALVRKLVREHC